MFEVADKASDYVYIFKHNSNIYEITFKLISLKMAPPSSLY